MDSGRSRSEEECLEMEFRVGKLFDRCLFLLDDGMDYFFQISTVFIVDLESAM